jgi:hypothetical protein
MNPQPMDIETELPYAIEPQGGIVVLEREGGAERNYTTALHRLPVFDARHSAPAPTLDVEGFCLVAYASRIHDFENPQHIEEHYYEETCRLVADLTGAAHVLAFDHNVRRDAGPEPAATGVHNPVRSVHNDYTERSAPQRVVDLLPKADANVRLGNRVAFINAWRPLRGPVRNGHLAICDARTVPASSLLRGELRFPDRVGEIYYCAFHADHRWLYFPQMMPDELLLLKVYDSATDGRARFAPHTAIDDPTAPPDAPPRESIEVRTIAFFD